MSSIPKSDALRNLYWRSEILRVMYWLRGEGMGDLVDVAMLRSYLDIGTDECRTQFDGLVEDRSVVVDGEWYAISPEGLAQGEAEYATLFSDLARPVSGPCSDECWCRLSSDEEAACSATLLMPTRKVDVWETATR
ncbi:MAG: hypothetical protein ACR2LJ_09170 [Acidimicrobiales bacterium]